MADEDLYKIEVSLDKLRDFWLEVALTNKQNLGGAYDIYPEVDEDFSSWLFRKKGRKKRVISDFLEFESRMRNRKLTQTSRINRIIERFSRTSYMIFDCSSSG